MSEAYSATNPPPPLTKLKAHPLRWLKNKATLVVLALVLAHIGMFMVVGGYYGLFETWAPMTNLWHHLVNDSLTRHMIRDIGEGFLGGFLAQQIIWNHYKKELKPRNLLDRIEIKLRIPNIKDERPLRGWQFAVSPLLAILYAVPGFVAGLLIVKYLQAHPAPVAAHTGHVHAALGAHANLWDRARTIWTGSWPKKIVGYGASLFFGRRPMRKVFDDGQLRFAQRRVAKRAGRTSRSLSNPYHSPTFRARCTHENQNWRGLYYRQKNSDTRLATTVMIGGLLAGLALAGFGFYVLTYIAHP